MTKHEALTSIAQTMLRCEFTGAAIPSVGEIARMVDRCAKLLDADVSEQNAAIVELARRYSL